MATQGRRSRRGRRLDEPSPPAKATARRPRRRRRADRRGVALVMVLGAITVLTVFLTELQEETSTELSAALAERDALRAEYYARSAVNLSRLLIATEPAVHKTVQPILSMIGSKLSQIPIWRFSDMLLAPFSAELGPPRPAGAPPPEGENAAPPPPVGGMPGVDLATGKNLGLSGGGRFELKIVDEESKININRAADGFNIQGQLSIAQQLLGLMSGQQYNPLFEERDADGQFSDRQTICGALVDWIDGDEKLFACDPSPNAGPSSGVEDNYYQTIGLDYRRKNAAFDSFEEMRLVRGISDDFWATFIDPDPNDPDKRSLTVWGKVDPKDKTAKVNVATADAQALLAVTCGLAPEAPLCTVPEQALAFLQTISLIKGLAPGGILFPSASDYYAAVTQGTKPIIGSLIGGFLKSMGVEPVVFKDKASVVKKNFSDKTNFLSVYADGIVPGNKRETRVRIHAVIDISGAAALSAIDPNAAATGGGGGAGGSATSGQSGTAAPESAWEQQVRANPAGVIVYYRIE